VQDVRGPPGPPGQRHQPARAEEGAFLVPPLHVAAVGVAQLEQGLPLLQPVFVLAVVGHAAAAVAHDGLQGGVVLDQQVTGAAAGEHLDAADAGLLLQHRKLRGVALRGADIQAHVAPCHALDIPLLPRDLAGAGDGGRGVRHVEHRREAAQHGGAGAGRDAFDGRVAGVAQVDVRVDQAGQDVQPGGLHHLVCRGIARHAQRRDPAAAHADIAGLLPPRQHQGAAAQQQVVMVGHGVFLMGRQVAAH